MDELGKIFSVENIEKEIRKSQYITYAKYAATAVVIGVGCYALYKINKNLSEINDSLKNIQRGVATTAPLNEEVVDI